MLNTCKSNGKPDFDWVESGERVSKTLVTCPEAGDNQWKRWLIPHKLDLVREGQGKERSALGGASELSASWWGKGLPRRRRLGGVRA
jgi:hypothetical protein